MEAPTPGRAGRDGAPRTSARGFGLLIVGLAIALAAMALARAPGLVERGYAAKVGPVVARGLSLLTGWVPFSVAVVLASGLLGAAGWKAASGVRRMRGGEAPRTVLVSGARWMSGVVGILLILFYASWGLNYARAPLDVRLGMAVDAPIDPAELAELTLLAAERTNEAYRALHGGSVDIGEPTAGLAAADATSRALEVGWGRVAAALGMTPVATRRYGPVKTLGVTRLIDFLDVAGIYVPFTGEAHVSGAQPDVAFPAVAAHEQAHQRGLARENEATFAGMLAAVHADDPLARYSGWARILRALQVDLARADREAWRETSGALHPGVLRDWRDYFEWLTESRSPAAPIVEATNDAYLRAHGVPGGIASYGRVTTLLLEWARAHDGRLTLLDAPGPG